MLVKLSLESCFTYIVEVQMMKTSRAQRMFVSFCFWLCLPLLCIATADAADHPALQPVKDLFAAMSKHDGKAMQETATEDFQLLEHGEDWTMQRLIEAVQPKGKPFERKNFFSQIRARQNGDVAWVSYWNKAEIHSESGLRTIVWLESAIMVKEVDRWKIQLLHSTRLAPEHHPKDIDWVLFETSP
jgi:hypothetical protein